MEPTEQATPGWIERLVAARGVLGLLTLLACALLCAGLPKLRFDASNRNLFLEGDPTLDRYDDFQRRFGADEVLYLLIEVQDPFQEPQLSQLLALGERLRALPHAVRLRSPFHSRVSFLEDGALVSRSVAEAAPASPEARAVWRERVRGYEPFQGLLCAPDLRTVAFSLQLERDMGHAARSELVRALRALRAEAPLRDWPHAATGTAVIPVLVGEILTRELARSLVAAGLVALVALWLLFRSLTAVAGTLLQLACAVAGTLGLMGHLGVPLTSLSVILVTLLACVGLADCMHVTAAYERHARSGLHLPAQAVGRALHETWWPCLVTSFTNAAGFLALLSAPLRPIAYLGLFAAAGTALAFGLFLGLAPLTLSWWRPSGRGAATPAEDPWARALLRLSRLAIRRPRTVLAVGLSLLALLGAGIPPTPDQYLLRDLRPDEPLRRDLEFIHARMGGTMSVEVVVEPLAPGDPEQLGEVLRRCEALQAWLSGLDPAVRSVRGIVDGVRELHTLFDGPRQVPRDAAGVAQLLLALQSADADWYEQHLTVGGTATRVNVRLDLIPSSACARIVERVERELDERFAGLARAHLTGGALLIVGSSAYVVETQVQSFAWSLLTVSLIVLLSVRSLRLGLVSLLPNVGPVLALLGLMGWLGIPLEVSSALIATVTLGIVVDDTVHVVHAFGDELRQGTPVEPAIERVLQRAGRAVLFTSLVLVVAFATYLGSSLRPIRTFGWLAAATFLVAFLADLLLLPALLRLTALRRGTPGP